MQLQNSYIFLPKKKETSKEKEDGVIHVSFISYLKNAFPTAIKTSERNTFKSEYTVEIDGSSLETRILIYNVVENYYLDIVVTGKSKAQIIKGLEYMQEAIDKSEISKGYIEIISYDAVSEYYCNKVYPKLNKLERNLRKLLFSTYVVNFGRDYYQTTISSDLRDKINSVIHARGNKEQKEITRLQEFFYSLEFVDVQQMLFVPQWTEVDEKSKIDFLESHDDLSKLADNELRKAFSEITPKSDWERFFADKMDADVIQSLIEKIRKSRNSIAHCKFFSRAEYEACNKAMDNFNKAIESAIAETESKDFLAKNSEKLGKILIIAAKRLKEIEENMTGVLPAVIQFTQKLSEISAPVTENITRNFSSQSFSQLEGYMAQIKRSTEQLDD